jgi:4a-hydroxytetrahydrobiopterin dehydratase
MAPTPTLTSQEITTGLQDLRSWKLNSQNRLEAEFKFKNFAEAFSFMTRIAFEAEKMDHHPDWSNSYNRVKIELVTHDSGGVTEKDLKLARKISAINWT